MNSLDLLRYCGSSLLAIACTVPRSHFPLRPLNGFANEEVRDENQG